MSFGSITIILLLPFFAACGNHYANGIANTGGDCSIGLPCGLKESIDGATTGSTIYLLSNTFHGFGEIIINKDLSVIGTSREAARISGSSRFLVVDSENSEMNDDVPIEMSPKRVSRRVQFDALPPRNVIYDILQYYTYRIDLTTMKKSQNEGKEGINPFCLFGTFKKDRTRNVWFVFQSISMKGDCQSVLVDVSRVSHLCLDSVFQNTFNWVSKNSPKMFFLVSLEITNFKMPLCCVDDMFTSECFPNLRSLSCDFSICVEGQSISFGKTFSQVNLKKLEKLALLDCSVPGRGLRYQGTVNIEPSMFVSSNVKKLKYLELNSYIPSSTHTTTRIEVPSVEKLVLESCEGIDVYPGESLTHLSSSFLDNGSFQRVYERSPNVETLKIQNLESPNSSWFLRKYINPLTRLKHVRLSDCESYEAEVPLDFGIHLESLDLYFIPEITDFVLFHEKIHYPNLRVLKLNFLPSIGETNPILSYSQQLEVLEVIDLSNIFDKFFQENDFRNLKTFLLHGSDSCDESEGKGMIRQLTGKDWLPMPNLVSLTLINLLNGKDEYFSTMNFEHLESLFIHFAGSELTGGNWKKMPKLKHLKLMTCQFVDDFFSHSVDWSQMETLSLLQVDNLTGKNWGVLDNYENGLKKLRCLELKSLDAHPILSQRIIQLWFLVLDFQNLETLTLRSEVELNVKMGKYWKAFPNLKNFWYNIKSDFVEEFWEKIPKDCAHKSSVRFNIDSGVRFLML